MNFTVTIHVPGSHMSYRAVHDSRALPFPVYSYT